MLNLNQFTPTNARRKESEHNANVRPILDWKFIRNTQILVPKTANITRNNPDRMISKSKNELKFPLGMSMEYTRNASTKISAIRSIIKTEKTIEIQLEFELVK